MIIKEEFFVDPLVEPEAVKYSQDLIIRASDSKPPVPIIHLRGHWMLDHACFHPEMNVRVEAVRGAIILRTFVHREVEGS